MTGRFERRKAFAKVMDQLKVVEEEKQEGKKANPNSCP